MNLYIAPVAFSNNQLLEKLIVLLQNTFHLQVQRINIPINIQQLYSAERNQYFSTGFLEQSLSQTAHLNGKTILITELDIYVPVLTFLFGEAQLNGNHSLVSIFRLHEEFYSGVIDNELLLERASKEVLHELGHNFGLIHCMQWDCVMHSSNNIEEVDIKGNSYCIECRNQIQSKLSA